MRILLGCILIAVALAAASMYTWNSLYFFAPLAIAGMLMRGGWKYVSTDRKDPWDGKQYEFDEDGQHYVVKDGTTYRKAKELGQAPGYDWGSPENFNSRPRTKVIKARRR